MARVVTAVAVAVLSIAIPAEALADRPRLQAQAPVDAGVPIVWFGTWKVNVEKSTYTGAPAYKRATYTIEPADGGLKVIYDMVLPRGGITHLEWTGKLDGKDYP